MQFLIASICFLFVDLGLPLNVAITSSFFGGRWEDVYFALRKRRRGDFFKPFLLFWTIGTAWMKEAYLLKWVHFRQVGKKFVPGECHYHSFWPWPTFSSVEERNQEERKESMRPPGESSFFCSENNCAANKAVCVFRRTMQISGMDQVFHCTGFSPGLIELV